MPSAALGVRESALSTLRKPLLSSQLRMAPMTVAPHPQYRPLPAGANPEMAILHEKLHAMLFRLDRVLISELHHFQGGHVQLIAAGNARRARVLFDSAGNSAGCSPG